MSDVEVPMTVLGANPNDSEDYLAGQASSQPEMNLRVSVEQKRPSGLVRKAKAIGFVGLATFAAVGGYEVYQALFGGQGEHAYAATISAPTTQVFEDVSLNLAEIDSTFHVYQHTELDRGDDDFIDLNPFDYNTTIDTDIRTTSKAGIRVGKLTATKKGKHLDVTVTGDLAFSQPAVDWDKSKVDPQIGSLDIGVGTGEIDHARASAMSLIGAAGEIADACAVRDNDVQTLFGKGVADFLKVTPIGQGIPAEDISVTIDGLGDKANTWYVERVDGLRQKVEEIKQSYGDPEHTFSVHTEDLENCAKHKISIVNPPVKK